MFFATVYYLYFNFKLWLVIQIWVINKMFLLKIFEQWIDNSAKFWLRSTFAKFCKSGDKARIACHSLSAN